MKELSFTNSIKKLEEQVDKTLHTLESTQHRIDELIVGLSWVWGGAHREGGVSWADYKPPLEVVEEDECPLVCTEVEEVFSNKYTFVLQRTDSGIGVKLRRGGTEVVRGRDEVS